MVKEERESRRRRGREERAQVKAASEGASGQRLLCSEVPLAAPEAVASFAAAARGYRGDRPSAPIYTCSGQESL